MNRQVNASTVSNSSITVTVNGQVYAGTVQVTGGGYEIQYTPTTPFPNSAAVQWWFSGSVQDVYGDLFNGTSGYFYTVGAAPNPTAATPTVIAISPRCCGETGLPTNTNVDIQFNVPIDATTLAGNVYINSGPATPFTLGLAPGTTNVVRITPTTPWTASTWYGFCTNANVKGTNGVAATSDCWATYFTTGTATDTTAGTVKIGPPDGSSNVGTNAYIRLQFSKPVDMTTINTTNVAITDERQSDSRQLLLQLQRKRCVRRQLLAGQSAAAFQRDCGQRQRAAGLRGQHLYGGDRNLHHRGNARLQQSKRLA